MILAQQAQRKAPRSGAERQRTFRQRQADRMAGLENECARLRGEAEGLRGELSVALAALADALEELERRPVNPCRHPASAVDGDTCRACGTEVW